MGVKLSELNINVVLNGDLTESITLDGDQIVSVQYDGDLQLGVEADGEMIATNTLDGELGVFNRISRETPYQGETEVTPSLEEQVLYTNDKLVRSNITIKPIPSNYGKITWNGSYLTVE